MPDLHHRHPAFVLSCIFGMLGLVLFVAAAAASVNGLYFAGIGAGALSLCAALYWRSVLVADWAERKRH